MGPRKPLTVLSLSGMQFKDFSLPRGMPLTRLQIDNTPLRDLELLKGMPLRAEARHTVFIHIENSFYMY